MVDTNTPQELKEQEEVAKYIFDNYMKPKMNNLNKDIEKEIKECNKLLKGIDNFLIETDKDFRGYKILTGFKEQFESKIRQSLTRIAEKTAKEKSNEYLIRYKEKCFNTDEINIMAIISNNSDNAIRKFWERIYPEGWYINKNFKYEILSIKKI